ncbi:MAG TPA: outer membrane lipoprotein carrier protein LolA [Puia sp.]|jgi:outer membrane lipoprotein-sorting protein|nr:outer membrane lipoprotein carrier protein LolA [Puia sp.]
MIKSFCLAGLLLSFFLCAAQYPGYTLLSNAETFKKSFTQATAFTESIQSNFKQEKSLSMLSEDIHSTGKFWYRKNDKIRMEYIQPYSYIMILNGGKIFIKEGQKENKISANSNKVFQQVNRILIDCVGGSMLDNPDFRSRIFESSGAFLVELIPLAKNLKELYKNINILIDKKDFTATEIAMFELSGDKTVIHFQNKVLNAKISDSVFNIP